MNKYDKYRDRPFIPDYGIEESEKGLLSWEFVDDELRDAKNYWLSTTRPNGYPHAIPIWGVWYNNNFYFGGGSETQNRKNLAKNPNIVVHSESGTKVVIIEGNVDVEDDDEVIKTIMKVYKEKYSLDHPPPFYRVNIFKVFAWNMNDYAGTPTRWRIKK